MVVALVNSPIQTAANVGCKKQDHAEQDTINDVSLKIILQIYFYQWY